MVIQLRPCTIMSTPPPHSSTPTWIGFQKLSFTHLYATPTSQPVQRSFASLISLVGVCAGCYQLLDDGKVISDARRVESGGPAGPARVHLCAVAEEEQDQV